MTLNLPYDAGNAGDLLKHGFLAEFVRAWSKHYDKAITYFDPFGGLPWHDLVNETVAERVKKLRGTALAAAQPDIIQKYYGSSFVMLNSGKVFGNAINAFVSDADEVHLELLRSANLQIINADGFHRTDGFSILDTKTSPDILLLDPYADFLPKRATEVIPKLASFSDLTTIVLFVLNLNHANAVGQRYESLLQNHCYRGWLVKCPPLSKTSVRGESKYYVEIVIIPAANLSNEMTYNLFSNFTGYCQTLSTILDAEITFGAIKEAVMAGSYCRGCGDHFPPPKHPKQCQECGPLGRNKRHYCEFCGEQVDSTECRHCNRSAGYP